MLFRRFIQSKIEEKLFKGKAIVVYGARRVGKTTLVREIEKKYLKESIYLNCDEPDVRAALTNKTSSELANYFGGKKLVIFDEAQRVLNIGLTLKLIVDNLKDIQVIATGSSSFDLSNKINEPLTGRVFDYFIAPLSLKEISDDKQEANRLLENRLIFGTYPEIVTSPSEARENLSSIYRNYLYKDALEFAGLKNPEIIEKLLAGLALQIGQEVSFTELAKLLEVDKKTVSSYVRLLELAFVIFRLPPYGNNLRQEINKTRKIYFWDLGIRNAILNNFNPINLRQDVGQLWENFIVAERLKKNNLETIKPNRYFWRTWDQQEVDYLETVDDKIAAFEIKWGKAGKKAPSQWLKNYPKASWQSINRENYWDFV